MEQYVTEEKFDAKCEEIKGEIASVRDNHLAELNSKTDDIWGTIKFIKQDVSSIKESIKSLRWSIIGWGSVIAIVLAILEVKVP